MGLGMVQKQSISTNCAPLIVGFLRGGVQAEGVPGEPEGFLLGRLEP